MRLELLTVSLYYRLLLVFHKTTSWGVPMSRPQPLMLLVPKGILYGCLPSIYMRKNMEPSLAVPLLIPVLALPSTGELFAYICISPSTHHFVIP